VNQLERRVLAGIKLHLLESELVAEFIDEFHRELTRLQNANAKAGSNFNLELQQIKQKIARLVSAIADGTDTPTLRQTLLSLEDKKTELERHSATSHTGIFVNPPPRAKLAAMFRRKVERLEDSLNAEPDITSMAAPVLPRT
jgi:hypothetical protein